MSEDAERRALAMFDAFVRGNADALRIVAHWGDGRCGALAHRMAEILLGPEPTQQNEPGGRSRSISARVRREVMERDRYRCVRCGTHRELCIDHIHPWSRGGSNEMANLQTLCAPCNSAKSDRVEDERT